MKKINNKGFTLIEVLAVLVILVAIMGIAIPTITSSMERTKEKQIDAKKEMLASYAEEYVEDNKNEIYKNLGDNNSCYISVKLLENKEYLTDTINLDVDGKKINGYIIFNKDTNSYKYSDTIEKIACDTIGEESIKEEESLTGGTETDNSNDSNSSTDEKVNYIEEISTTSTTVNLQKSQSVVFSSYNFDATTGTFELTGTSQSYYMLDSGEFTSLSGMVGRGYLKYVCNDFNSSSCNEIYELQTVSYNSGGSTSTLTYIKHSAQKNNNIK